VFVCADFFRRYYNQKYRANRKTVLLELTPPVTSRKSPDATEHLFSVLYNLGRSITLKDKILGRSRIFSFEVVATRREGIRFMVQLDDTDRESFQQQLAAYLPDVRFSVVKDPLKSLSSNTSISVTDYKQARHFAYPLASHDSLSQKDPIAYLTGSMTKLENGELVAYQMVVSPCISSQANRIRNRLILGKDPGLSKLRSHTFLNYFLTFVKIALLPLRFAAVVISEASGSGDYHAHHSATKSPAVMALESSFNEKLSQPLFQASIRTLVASNDEERIRQISSGLRAALGAFHVPGYQGLVARRSLVPKKNADKLWDRLFYRDHGPSLKQASVLSVSEVASLYHFPYGQNINTEGLVRSHSRTLPSPVERKEYADTKGYDVILGVNKHHGSETPLGLTAAERERHVYILGGTGNGKTTMLEYAIVQDIKAGKGVAVIDPHGDLAESLLRYIPKSRVKDVIYFNPRDISHPIGLNLLEQPKGLDKDDLLIEQDFITESIVSVFRKIFSEDDSGGHRIEHFLRNAIHTAFTVPDATLFTVYKLLTNTKFRRSIVSQLEDEDLIDFWKGEFNSAGDYQKVKMSSGVNAKLGRFSRSVVTRRILEQPVSTIDFDDIIQNKKILICNFPKGKIGEDTSALLGTSVLTKLQLAALRRSRINKDDRTPFYLYVDEFQNLATSSFSQVLSEARKYKLFLTIAEQTTAQQQDKRLTEVILANVGTVICFRTGSTQDEKLLLPLFSPSIDTGELSNLEAYNFYARIMAIKPQEPVSGETVLLDKKGSDIVAKKVIDMSREKYANEFEESSSNRNRHREVIKPNLNNQDFRNSRKHVAPIGNDNNLMK
jgi:hypothetical protein